MSNQKPTDLRAEPSSAAPHPEEMKASAEFRIGERVVITASARATPAGLAAAALLVCSMLLPIIWLRRSRR